MDLGSPFNAFAEWFQPELAAAEGAAFHLLTTVVRVIVVRDPPSPLDKPAPIGVFLIPTPQSNPRVLTLAAGQVLLASRQLAPSPDAAVGFDISAGTLTFQANVTVSNGEIHVPAPELVQLDATLKSPPNPPPGAGPGADARAVVANLPASITIDFAETGGTITKLPNFGATVYGTVVTLSRNAIAPSFNGVLRQLLVPASVTPTTFAIARHQSTLLELGSSAPITGGAWALPVITTLPPLGTNLGAGSVEIVLGSGIKATWAGIAQTTGPQTTTILAAPGQIGVVLAIQTQPFSETFQLWQESGGARNSTVQFDYPVQFTIFYAAQPGQETLSLNGPASAHLDRPLRADGTRFSLPVPGCSQTLVLTTAGLQLTLSGAPQTPPNNPLIPIALENALLQVRSPNSFSLTGTLTGASVSSGSIALNFPLHAIVPFLPDPYAADLPASTLVSQQQADLGQLAATITWTTRSSAALAFSYQPAARGAQAQLPSLLDVSSNADQLGVMSESADPPQLSIAQLSLQAPGGLMAVFTVPEISWEPMVQDPASQPPPGSTTPPDDGGKSIIFVQTVQLVPVSPAVVAEAFVQAVSQGAPATAELTLPFGILANISDFKGATFDLNRPVFPSSLTGGIQIKLQPPSPQNDKAAFSGRAFVTPSSQYGVNVLGTQVASFFNQEFNGITFSVPVRRYDFSGYGASVFSEWRDVNASTAAVIKVQFDVFVGRTAFEVIQIQSFIYPWIIKVVRTVTIQRKDLGGVIRFDSGWQAATDGRYIFPNAGFDVHQGAVNAVVRVRNIRDAGPIFPANASPGAATWGPVLFDADVELNGNLAINSGASGPNTVASRDMTGYIVETVGFTPAPNDVATLLATNPAGGPVSCTVTIASSGAQLRGAGVDITGFMSTNCEIVGALRGSPVLPPDGAWSVGKRSVVGTSPPLPLDPNFPVPLVQNATQPTLWYYAEPSDILNLPGGTPAQEYGLLQSTGTQKLFFAQPRITQGVQNVQPQVQPHMADVGALLNAVGAFPDLKAALQMTQPFPPLDTSNPNGIKFHKEFDTVDASNKPLPSDTLIDFGANVLQVKLAYSDGKGTPAHAIVDITPGSWQIQLKHISLPLITPFGDETDPLLRVVGDALASSSSAPTVSNLNVVYGGALSEVEQVFSNLEQLASFLPGAPFSSLDVHFSDGKLTIRDTFALPELPLGIGFVTDVSLDLGMGLQLSPQSLEFTAGLGSEQKPFHWLVSPLSGTGAVVVGMKDGLPAFLVQGGIGVGLSIDIGIASGAASIVLQVQIATEGTLIHLKAMLTGQASVDVLDGLASAALSMTAGLGITPRGGIPPTSVDFVASVAVGIHISICWVVHVDFDGYWQYSQTVDLPSIGSVIPT